MELTSKQQKAIQTTREKATYLFAGQVNTETGEVTEQYELMLTVKVGIYTVLKPEVKDVDPETYSVDVVRGTCTCPMFESSQKATGNGECKHLNSTQDLVFRGIAVGMSSDWIGEFYNPELRPNYLLSPELDTTKTEEEVDSCDWLGCDAPLNLPPIKALPVRVPPPVTLARLGNNDRMWA